MPGLREDRNRMKHRMLFRSAALRLLSCRLCQASQFASRRARPSCARECRHRRSHTAGSCSASCAPKVRARARRGCDCRGSAPASAARARARSPRPWSRSASARSDGVKGLENPTAKSRACTHSPRQGTSHGSAKILLGHQHLPIDACSETRSRNIRNQQPPSRRGRVDANG